MLQWALGQHEVVYEETESQKEEKRRELGRDYRGGKAGEGSGGKGEREKSPPSVVPSKNVSRHFHMSPRAQHYPWLQTTNLIHVQNYYKSIIE